jgi:hypothetical protein
MTIQHKELAAGRWYTLSLVEQMANVGSEVGRALNWKERGNHAYAENAYVRALELLDLTLNDPRHRYRTREIARVREFLVDTLDGTNEYGSTPELWRKYFDAFALAARRNK